jgi:hypothetical protein
MAKNELFRATKNRCHQVVMQFKVKQLNMIYQLLKQLFTLYKAEMAKAATD